MIRVYLSGPYSAATPELVLANVHRALAAQDRLEAAGFAVHCPHLRHFLHERHPRDYEHHMAQDFEWIPSCEVFVRLPGESSGADREMRKAAERGLFVTTLEDAIARFGRDALEAGAARALRFPPALGDWGRVDPATFEPISEAARFEAEAEAFHRETGMLAPGKDQPAAMNGTPSDEDRRAAWDAWTAKRSGRTS